MPLPFRLVSSALAGCLVLAAAAPAMADDFFKRFTIGVVPTYLASGTSDATAPLPAGYTAIGFSKDHPVPNDLRLDYNADVKLSRKTNLYYTHVSNDFALSRILSLAPKTAYEPGTFGDRTDTIGVRYGLAKGLSSRAYYFNHQRSEVTGLCNNQIQCTNKEGQLYNNPGTIDEHGFGAGLTYAFGPTTRIGSLFSASFDAHYIPRSANVEGAKLNGLAHYTGSQFIYPYSVTMKVPVLNDKTVTPTIGYARATVLYRHESSPQVYNIVSYGVNKVFNKNVSMDIDNLNVVGCKCADTVPPPDVVRFDVIRAKLNLKTQL